MPTPFWVKKKCLLRRPSKPADARIASAPAVPGEPVGDQAMFFIVEPLGGISPWQSQNRA
jgi:hypothetical protein